MLPQKKFLHCHTYTCQVSCSSKVILNSLAQKELIGWGIAHSVLPRMRCGELHGQILAAVQLRRCAWLSKFIYGLSAHVCVCTCVCGEAARYINWVCAFALQRCMRWMQAWQSCWIKVVELKMRSVPCLTLVPRTPFWPCRDGARVWLEFRWSFCGSRLKNS